MSVRTEPRDISQQLQQTLSIPAEVMTAAASHNHQNALVSASAGDVGGEQHLHEANTFNNTNEHHPLERTVCVNIRASLSDLCLKTQKATWAPPSAEATKSIFQQAPKRPTALKRPGLGPWPPRLAHHPQVPAAEASRLSSLRPVLAPCRACPASPRFSPQYNANQPHTPSRTHRAAHCADRPYVGGVRSASSWTSAALRRTRVRASARRM